MFSKRDTLKVKGVAILFLLFHHLFWDRNYVAVMRGGATEELLNVLCPTAYAARVCVWVFAFLSAYGLTYNFKQWKGTTINFILRRILILLSGVFFVFPFALILLWLAGVDIGSLYNHSILNVILDFFAVSDFFNTPTISGAWWYICMTQVIIWIIPICYWGCKKAGGLIIPFTFLLLQYLPSGIVSMYGGAYTDYLLAVVIGVYFATYDVFDKILIKPKKKSLCILDLGAAFVLFLILILIRDKFVDGVIFTDPWKIATSSAAVATVLLVYMITKYVTWTPLEKVLCFLGKHSGNIYLIHTVFYINWGTIVYWNSNSAITFCTLLDLCLLFSVIIEFVKKISGYNKLIVFLNEKMNNLFVKKEKNVL